MPTFYGESVVLRILENYLENVKLETLGFFPESIKLLKKILIIMGILKDSKSIFYFWFDFYLIRNSSIL